jgi:ABC-2 type transport system ATP-binding protein
MSALLELSEVRQSFRTGFWMSQVEILKGISLSIQEKTIFGFLGPNGAGKTTLIHLIVGLRRPTSGSLRLKGVDCFEAGARARVGYLPERPYFHEHLTGEGLLRYFGALSGMKRPALVSRIPKVLSAVGLSHAGKTELRRYSKGMLQRIGIAQAILHDPEFLVLDEPMSGLDPLGRKEMRELIQNLANEGRTIFFSTHVIPDVEAICDQFALIQKGKLVGSGPISQFLASGETQMEVAFAGLAPDRARAIPGFASLREIPEGFRGVVPSQGKINDVLGELMKAGSQILWVNPLRPSLENFFEKGSTS